MDEKLLQFFRELPDGLKVLVFLVLLAATIVLTVLQVLSWKRNRERENELDRTRASLVGVIDERNQLQSRFAALDQIDNHVWTKPDACQRNRFVPRSQRSARFVAMCNLKGGVGKTTMVLNLGVALALRGKRILLIDLDFQGTLSNLAVPGELVEDYRRKGWTSEALLSEHATVKQAMEIMFSVQDGAGCRIILARENLEIREFEEQSRFFVKPEHEVRFFLQRLLHAPEIAQSYDYVFLDCPPRMTTACVNALTCADYLLIPTTLSQLDIEAVPRTLNWLKELHAIVRADFLGAVITRARGRSGQLFSYEATQLDNLKQLIRDHHAGEGFIFSATIPESPKIHRITAEHKAAVAHLTEIRELFDAVAQELERKVLP